ncbi:MAG: ArsA family ATPase, partial [Deltaproteobacteria bacterium]
MSLAGVLSAHRVIVCVGSGGVGKTTTAAALALKGALEG